jgi:hypothetical protein
MRATNGGGEYSTVQQYAIYFDVPLKEAFSSKIFHSEEVNCSPICDHTNSKSPLFVLDAGGSFVKIAHNTIVLPFDCSFFDDLQHVNINNNQENGS